MWFLLLLSLLPPSYLFVRDACAPNAFEGSV
jgi:hypothetical protein